MDNFYTLEEGAGIICMTRDLACTLFEGTMKGVSFCTQGCTTFTLGYILRALFEGSKKLAVYSDLNVSLMSKVR